MRLLICGDRNWLDRDAIFDVVKELNPNCIIEGDARGADKLAGIVADMLGIPKEVYPAQWDKHHRAAGPIRNQQMLTEGKPDLVLAFHDDLLSSKGTKDMVKRSLKAQLPVVCFSHSRGLHPAPVGLK